MVISSYTGYGEHTIDKSLEVFEIIPFDTYVKFNGTILKQMPYMLICGNALPFIADLYLSWC